MTFGQNSGPPATARQVQALSTLLTAAGHTDFRDARGPLGLTQRQAGGKFTRDEADALIARLEAEAAGPQDEHAGETPSPRGAPRLPTEGLLNDVPTSALAAELQRRGWVVVQP